MKKILLSTTIIIAFSNLVNAQQLGQYSQYLNNHFLMNPAAAGAEEGLDIGLGFRQQWVGFDNSPQNYYLTINTPLNIGGAPKVNSSLRTGSAELIQSEESSTLQLKHGVGGYIAADNYGPFKRISGVAAYAIHLPIANKVHWSFGLNTGLSNINFDRNQITLIDDTDNTFATFATTQGKINYFDVNLGTYVYNKKFYFGYASNQLMQNKIYFGGTPTDGKLHMHHFIMGGYNFDISDKLVLTPSVLIKYMNPAPLSMDITAKLTYDNKFFGGFSYRNGDAVIVLLGAKFNDMFRIGYSLDYTLSGLSDHNSGSHEIMLGITLKK